MKSSRRVVVDTNLLVSRFISRHGAAAEVFRHIYFSLHIAGVYRYGRGISRGDLPV